jgi:hypothetical protein
MLETGQLTTEKRSMTFSETTCPMRIAFAALAAWPLATLSAPAFLREARGQQPVDVGQADARQSAPAVERFTGSLTVRQKGGGLYYKIYVVDGEVIGGYDAWRGNATHYHRLAGGWFDGARLALLVQSTRHDFDDKWFSHAHHFEREGDELVLKHTLYGFGKTTDTGEVYAPHVIEATAALPVEEVRRLAAADAEEPSAPAAPDAKAAALAKRLARLERENLRLKQLVGELALEKAVSQDETSDRD